MDMDRLTESEAIRLFINRSSRPLSDLGLTGSPWTNERLIQGLPAVHKKMAEKFNKRVYLDSECWFNEDDKISWLSPLLKALEKNLIILLHYKKKDGQAIRRKIFPYALVAKTNIWYLVAKHEEVLHVYRVSRILEVQLTQKSFSFPAGFNISLFWQKWCADFEKSLTCYPVILRAQKNSLDLLCVSRSKIKSLSDAEKNLYEVIFENEDEAEKELLGLGAEAEVIYPEKLRKRIIDQLQQALFVYYGK